MSSPTTIMAGHAPCHVHAAASSVGKGSPYLSSVLPAPPGGEIASLPCYKNPKKTNNLLVSWNGVYKDPFTLWSNLKERYDHQKTVILPKARYDWMHLRLPDFKTVSEYNSALFKTIMHVVALVSIRPATYHKYSPSQLVLGKQPNISHLWIFGCAIYVPIAPTQRTKMGPQQRLRIYVGFDSPSIIRYLEPLTRVFLQPALQIVILMRVFSHH